MTLGDESPRSLALQPFPRQTKPSYLQVNGQCVTSMARVWENGDEARCRLCVECTAEDGLCLITVIAHVPRESCPLFSTLGLRKQGALAGGEVRGPTFQIKRG